MADFDSADISLVLGATGVLAAFNDHGVLGPADLHVARAVCEAAGETAADLALLTALTVRALRAGSVCLDLTDVPAGPADPTTAQWDLPAECWPEVAWQERLADSPLTSAAEGAPGPLVLDGQRVYLQRYWLEEGVILADLLERLAAAPATQPDQAALERYFPDEASREQAHAARLALTHNITVITGGPGTGKTTTVARLLGVLLTENPQARIALAAPTGKAAARMVEALTDAAHHPAFPGEHAEQIARLPASTIHRLLRYSPHAGFRHDRSDPVPYDVIVIDEASMVDLTLMARLLEAIDARAKVVFVGDAHQLASVEVGAVFADLTDGLGALANSPVTELTRSHRFGAQIHQVAEAIKAGDGDRATALIHADGETDAPIAALAEGDLPGELLAGMRAMHVAATAGDGRAALALAEEQQLLCAHRSGPFGASHWNDRLRQELAGALGVRLPEWFPGQPILITRNNYSLDLFNGDAGVIIERSGRLVAVFAHGEDLREVPLAQLPDIEPAYAITIHRSQGSQYGRVFVLLPPADSPLLTRELLYTAVTRATDTVRVIGSREVIGAAVAHRVRRASGLAPRLEAAGRDMAGPDEGRP